MMDEKVFVFFGATGNLFSEKIFPAFYHLLLRKKIHNFRIIASGRRFSTETDYHQFLQRILEKKISLLDPPVLHDLLQRTSYFPGDVERDDTFSLFASQTRLFDSSEILFYLSTLPSLYLPTIHLIQKILLPVSSTSSFHKIIIEKPFGSDAKSFLYLVKTIQNIFTEENIFLVDHYLGKETVQNLIILKAENLLIEKILSRDFVEEIHIVVLESEGVGRRGAFYEETGAIRDMVQNHILQLISLIAMDVPSLCEGDKKECRVFMEKMTRGKNEIIQKIRLPSLSKIRIGQYQGYRREVSVPGSQVETLTHLPFFLDTERWKDVPFWILTGKKMAHKQSYIEVIFRSSTENKNRLWIEIQPEERIDFFINSKKPGEGLASTPVRLNFNVLGTFGINSPEAYENILFDCYQGDKTLFPDPGFILQSWKIIDQLKALLHQGKIKPETYPDDNLTPEYFFSSV